MGGTQDTGLRRETIIACGKEFDRLPHKLPETSVEVGHAY